MAEKYVLQAPDGAGEMVIEGTYYWPNEAGLVETTNPLHRDVMLRHGCGVVETRQIAPPPSALGMIDAEELSRPDLIQQLGIRGILPAPGATRSELEEHARAWNDARKGRIDQSQRAAALSTSAPAELGFTGAQLAWLKENGFVGAIASAPASEPERKPADDEEATAEQIDAMKTAELEDWLTGRGIAFAPKTPIASLRRIAHRALGLVEA